MKLSPQQQMAELLILKSVCGLEPQEQQQLNRLQREINVSESKLQNEMDRIELAAAAADLASFSSDSDSMPEHLKDCVLVEAGKYFESQTEHPGNQPADFRDVTRYQNSNSGVNGWMIGTIISTAACILLLLNAMSADKTPPDNPPLSVAQKMEQFLDAKPADLINVALLPAYDSNGSNIENSRLVWSDKLQKGYMKFTGLKVNDPTAEQYQLWIFKDINQEHPVDGGVFDISGDEEVIEIDAKILAEKTSMFAITVEKPGGVVVSDRLRIASIDENFGAALAEANKSEQEGAEK